MRKFQVIVNGQSYVVEVEEFEGAAPVASAPAASAPVKPAAVSTAGTTNVPCPMPGTILDVKVKPGDAVKAGDVLVVLEAMKMENEIPAPRNGVVAAVLVTKGASVGSGDVLVTLK